MTYTLGDAMRAGRQRAAADREEQARERKATRKLAAVLRGSRPNPRSIRRASGSGGSGKGSYTSRGKVPGTILKIGRGDALHGDEYDESKEGARLLDTNMLSLDAAGRRAEWRTDFAARPRVAPSRLTKHISLSRPPGHDLSDQQWRDLARTWLDEIGARGAKFVLHKHTDEPQPHVHISFSRLLPGVPGGKLISDSWERLKWREALRRAETRVGLAHELPRAERPETPGDRAAAAHRRATRHGTVPAWVDPAHVRAAMARSNNLDQLARELQARGVEMQVSRRADGSARGLLLRAHGSHEWLGAAQVARDLSLPRVEAALAARQAPAAPSPYYPPPPPRQARPAAPQPPRERGG